MIWEASMLPRLVPVGPKGLGKPLSEHSKIILPALLYVNKDSRYCALRHYSLRFTITLTVDETGKHQWNCPEFQGTEHHANVVMSPDDTLGFFGWETLRQGYGTRFGVKNANGIWASYPTDLGAQPEVKKVAFLRPEIVSDPRFIHYLNRGASWDWDSSLHGKLSSVRKLDVPWDVWHRLPHGFCSIWKPKVLIQSHNFSGTLKDWGIRLIHRAKHGALPTWSGGPDILAFRLGKGPRKIHRPWTFVPAESVQDLYAVLPSNFVRNILDDFYASREWAWSVRHPSGRGF